MGSAEDRRFEVGIEHLHRYVAAHGSSSPPRGARIDGFPIDVWVASRRTDYRKGRLSAERIERLATEFPDWRWSVRDAQFDVGLAHLRSYVATRGTSTVGQHEMFDGFALGQWVTNRRADYRKGRLSAERIKVFEREFPDWQWSPQATAAAAAFEAGIAHLHRYVATHGTSNARHRAVIDGFAIGQWVANRRADYRKGQLATERIRAGDLHAARLAWVAAGKDLFPAERLAAEWPDYVVTATTALALHGLAEAVSPPQLAVIKTGKPRERSSTADVLGLERPLRWGTDVTMRRGLPVATPASAINALSTVGRDLVDDFATYLDGVAAAADDRRDREAILAAIASAT